MVKLIIVLIIVLGAIAIAQLVRLYEISSKANNRREEDVPFRDNKLNANLLLGFMFFMFLGFIWLCLKYGWTGRGPAASVEGLDTDWLLNLNFIVIIAVFFLTNFLLFFFAFKYVKKPGTKAYWFPHDNKLELIWTIVPAVVLAVIIILGLQSWQRQTSRAKDDAILVELYSKQFDWTVRYAGEDGKLGFFDYRLMNDNNGLALLTKESIQNAIDSMENGTTGISKLKSVLNNPKIMLAPEDFELKKNDLERKERFVRQLYQLQQKHNSDYDKNAYDDIVFSAGDVLYLKKGSQYEFNLRARDVIHSAFFPHFRQQMNAVPGMTTRLKFTPILSTEEMREEMNDEKFEYMLMCNKICGGSHYKMRLLIKVLEPEAYDKWMLSVSYKDNAKHNAMYKKLYGRVPTKDDKKMLSEGNKSFGASYAVLKAIKGTVSTISSVVDSTATDSVM